MDKSRVETNGSKKREEVVYILCESLGLLRLLVVDGRPGWVVEKSVATGHKDLENCGFLRLSFSRTNTSREDC